MRKPETKLMSAIFSYPEGGAFFEEDELLEAVDGVTLRAMLLTVLTEFENPPDTHYYRYQKPRNPIFRSQVKRVMMLRFGFEDGRSHTLEEIGQDFQLTRERIRQIEGKALRLLRHPTKSRRLKPYIREPQRIQQ